MRSGSTTDYPTCPPVYPPLIFGLRPGFPRQSYTLCMYGAVQCMSLARPLLMEESWADGNLDLSEVCIWVCHPSMPRVFPSSSTCAQEESLLSGTSVLTTGSLPYPAPFKIYLTSMQTSGAVCLEPSPVTSLMMTPLLMGSLNHPLRWSSLNLHQGSIL